MADLTTHCADLLCSGTCRQKGQALYFICNQEVMLLQGWQAPPLPLPQISPRGEPVPCVNPDTSSIEASSWLLAPSYHLHQVLYSQASVRCWLEAGLISISWVLDTRQQACHSTSLLLRRCKGASFHSTDLCLLKRMSCTFYVTDALTRCEPPSALSQVQHAFAPSEGEAGGDRRPIRRGSLYTAAVKTEGSGSSGAEEIRLPDFGQAGSAFQLVAGPLTSPAAAFAHSSNKQGACRVKAKEEALDPDECAQGRTYAYY